MNTTINNLNNINADINKQRDVVTEQVNIELNKYKSEQNIEEIIDPETALIPLNTEIKLEKKEDYINELEKFLVQIEPTIDGIKQIKSENNEKISLDIENPHLKVEDSFIIDDIERADENKKKITVYDLPKIEPLDDIIDLPNLNENINGINSNDNIIKDDKTNVVKQDNKLLTSETISEPIELDLTDSDDKFSLDLDQDEKKVKLELNENINFENDEDNNLKFELKYEETKPGFLEDFPSKDNLGNEIIQIDTEYDKIDIDNNIKEEEMDTNYERPVVVLPTSHLINLRKIKMKREPTKSKILRDSIYQRPVLENDIEFIKQIPVHPRNRKNRKIKQEILEDQNKAKFAKEKINEKILDFNAKENDIEFLRQVPVHPRNRKNRKITIKQEIDKDKEMDTNYERPIVVLPTSHLVNLRKRKMKKASSMRDVKKRKTKPITKKIKQEMLDKYYTDQESVKFIAQKPVHPRYRKIKSLPKIKIDKSAEKYLKMSDFDIKFNSIQHLSRNDRTERIMDILINKFPSDNNEYSIKYDPKIDTFTIYRDV